jgi:hypothetical protein
MSRNECFFLGSNVLGFISICDLFTDCSTCAHVNGRCGLPHIDDVPSSRRICK